MQNLILGAQFLILNFCRIPEVVKFIKIMKNIVRKNAIFWKTNALCAKINIKKSKFAWAQMCKKLVTLKGNLTFFEVMPFYFPSTR